MEYEGRLYVQVKDPKDWEALYDIQIDKSYALIAHTGKDVFGNIKGTEWYIDGGWSPAPEDEMDLMSGLGGLFMEIRSRLQDRCVIYGDLVNLDTDPYYYIYYSFGDDYDCKELYLPGFAADLLSPKKWFKWAKISINDSRIKHLVYFNGIFDYLKKKPAVRLDPALGDDQRRGRIMISVKDPSMWKKAAVIKLDQQFNLPADAKTLFGELQTYDFVLEQNWRIPFGLDSKDPLPRLAAALKKALGNDFILLADCADPDASPLYAYLCVIEGTVIKDEVFTDLSTASIKEPEAWMKLTDIRMSDKRKRFLADLPSPAFDFARGGLPSPKLHAVFDKDWMRGKDFVLIGFDVPEKAMMQKIIEARGGRTEADISQAIDIAVYDPKRSDQYLLGQIQDLIISGKAVITMTGEDFWKNSKSNTIIKIKRIIKLSRIRENFYDLRNLKKRVAGLLWHSHGPLPCCVGRRAACAERR